MLKTRKKFLHHGASLSHHIKFIKFLLDQGSQSEFLNAITSLVSALKLANPDELNDKTNKKSIIIYCLKASSIYFIRSMASFISLILKELYSKSIELLEYARDLVSDPITLDPSLEKLRHVIYNNLAIYCLKTHDNVTAKKLLASCINKSNNSDPYLISVFLNNLASMYIQQKEFKKAFQVSNKTIEILNEEVTSLLHLIIPEIAADDHRLKHRVTILLIAKLNLGVCIENNPTLNPEITPRDLYADGLEMAVKVLGESHIITQKFQARFARSDMVLYRDVFSIDKTESFIENMRTSKSSMASEKRSKTPGVSPNSNSRHTLKTMLSQFDTDNAEEEEQITPLIHKKKSSRKIIRPVSAIEFNKPSPTISLNLEKNTKDLKIRSAQTSFSKMDTPTSISPNGRRSMVSQPISLIENLDSDVTPLVAKPQPPSKTHHRRRKFSPSPSSKHLKLAPIAQSQRVSRSSSISEPDKSLLSVSLALLMHQQKDFEEKLSKKIEETFNKRKLRVKKPSNGEGEKALRNSVSQDLKAKQLELELNYLKEEREKMLKAKQEKECELENLKKLIALTGEQYGSLGFTEDSEQQKFEPSIMAQETPRKQIDKLFNQNVPSPIISKRERPHPAVTITRVELKDDSQVIGTRGKVGSQEEMKEDTTAATKNESKAENVRRESIHKSISETETLSPAISQRSLQSKSPERRPGVSLNIPTGLEALETSGQLEKKGTEFERNAVLKKKIILDDQEPHFIFCRGHLRKHEKVFKIQLTTPYVTSDSEMIVLAEDEIRIPELSSLANQFMYKDTIPSHLHIKHMRGTPPFIRFLLMPFIAIEKNPKTGKPEIRLTAKARGITDVQKLEFLGQRCFLTFHHIMNNNFRLVLTKENSENKVIRIDMELDQGTIEEVFFKVGGPKPGETRPVDQMMKIIEGFDEDDDVAIQEAANIVKSLQGKSVVDEILIENFKPKVMKNLIDNLIAILKDVESFIKEKQIADFNKLTDEKTRAYMKIKVVNEFKRNKFFYLVDVPEKGIISVHIKNFFESWGPSRTKVKASGYYEYKVDNLWKHLGLAYNKLDQEDKYTVLSLLVENFVLDVFEKPFDEEDNDRWEENPIRFVPLETTACSRVYLGKNYKCPLTLSLVGTKLRPLGIKVTIYNLDDVSESGVFLFLNDKYWEKTAEDMAKKKIRRYNFVPVLDNYYLEYILKVGGWEIIRNALVLATNPNRIDIMGTRIVKGYSMTDQLENIVNVHTLIAFFKERQEMEEKIL